QFTPIRKGGRLHGRGACDTKGSIAAMLTALIEVANSPDRPRETEIIFCAFVDEEDGQTGSRALVQRGFKADLAIVGEPTRLQLVHQFLKTVGQREPAGVDFFCDAAVLGAGGIPCVVLGPGDIAQAHTSDEWISIKSLDRATAILKRFLMSLP